MLLGLAKLSREVLSLGAKVQTLFVDDDFTGAAASMTGRTPDTVAGTTWQGTGTSTDGSGSCSGAGCYLDIGTPNFRMVVTTLMEPVGLNIMGKGFDASTTRTFMNMQYGSGLAVLQEHTGGNFFARCSFSGIAAEGTDGTYYLDYNSNGCTIGRVGGNSASGILSDSNNINSTKMFLCDGAGTEKKRRVQVFK